MNPLFTFDFKKAIEIGVNTNIVVYNSKDQYNVFDIDFVDFIDKIYYENNNRHLTDIFLEPDGHSKFTLWNNISIHRITGFKVWQDYFLKVLDGSLAANDKYLILGVDRNADDIKDSVVLGSY